jgi:hypothetical protein
MREKHRFPDFWWSDDEDTPQKRELTEIQKSHPLFQNNFIPTTQECYSLRDTVNADLTRLETLSAEIAKLTEEHAELEELTRLCRSVVSPIRRFPAELILEIVSYAMDTDPENASVGGFDTDSGPWLYAKVCRLWRTVINGSPKMWSRLDIDFQINRAKTQPAIIEQALKRSQKCLLTIRFVASAPLKDPAKEIINLLYTHADRWHTVKFSVAFTQPMIKMFQKLQRRLPVLRSLHFTHRRPDAGKYEFPIPILNSFVSEAPSLRRLVIRGNVPAPESSSFSIPWKQLHFLDIHIREWDDEKSIRTTLLLDGLKLMPNALELRAQRRCRSLLKSSDSEFLTLPLLHKATIASAGLLPVLVLPALSVVELQLNTHTGHDLWGDRREENADPVNGDEAIISQFSHLLERSSPPLQEVTFNGLLDISDALDLLQSLPSSVHTLHLINCGYEESIFPCLTIPESSASPPVLPQLEHLKVTCTANSSINIELLSHTIRSRYHSSNTSVSSLRSVVFEAEMDSDIDIPSSQDQNAILGLQNTGLYISLTFRVASARSPGYHRYPSSSSDRYDDYWFKEM